MATRIAFVITGLGVGGAEAMLFKLLQHIDRERFEPHVVSLTDGGEYGPRLQALGIPVHAIGMARGAGGALRFFDLVRVLRRIAPQAVHTWMYHADLFGGLAARRAGVRRVIWGIRHTDLSREHNKRSTLAVVAACARLSRRVPDAILSCSQRAMQAHIAAGYAADRFTVIPNGFELDRFAPSPAARVELREALGIAADAPVVGHVGRFHPQKNHGGLLQAASLVLAARPEVRFVLAGAGAERANPAFRQLIEHAGVDERCIALGPRDDVPRLMSAFDLLASSSHGEGFPNVVGEAMACALPCVVTDVGDCAEVVGDTGLVVLPGDPRALADALLQLLGRPQAERRTLGARARERVRSRFEIHAVVAAHERFYERILGSV